MAHLWRSRKRAARARSATILAPDSGTAGDITVVVEDNALAAELVRLACLVSRRAGRGIRLLYIIEVPRTLPLKAALTAEATQADRVLTHALTIADECGCQARAEIVQTRDAASALVDEVRDQPCSLLLISIVRRGKPGGDTLGRVVPFVLSHVPCRVWLIQEDLPL
jgi:hypothetical protein